MTKYRTVAVCACICICSSLLPADTVTLRSGKTLTGLIRDESGSSIRIESPSGILTIPRSQVASIQRTNNKTVAQLQLTYAAGKYDEFLSSLSAVDMGSLSESDRSDLKALESNAIEARDAAQKKATALEAEVQAEAARRQRIVEAQARELRLKDYKRQENAERASHRVVLRQSSTASAASNGMSAAEKRRERNQERARKRERAEANRGGSCQ